VDLRAVGRAVATAVGEAPDAVHLLARGNTSTAWRARVRSTWWVVRGPTEAGASTSYRTEATIGQALAARGHPVATWRVVGVDGVECCVGPMLPGGPVDPMRPWSEAFVTSLAAALRDLHRLPSDGWGRLDDVEAALRGRSDDPVEGIVHRWHRAAIWPFDDTVLATHPALHDSPDVLDRVRRASDAIVEAAGTGRAVLHSDLHRQHLLQAPDGTLAGLLDFGDAFVGSPAWDFALLHHHYGPTIAERVLAAYPGAPDLSRHARLLAVAVGLYQVAKHPDRPAARDRLRVSVAAALPG
jgi:aminoglycoside phosphotransferase (APT) family kinase protein